MPFACEAIDERGKPITSVVDAATAEEATDQLRARGLFVTRVQEASAEAAPAADGRRVAMFHGRAGNTRDLLLLTRQMSMMLRAGSRVVPALEAIEQQTTKPRWRAIVGEVRHAVETGSSLSMALAEYPEMFNQTFRAIVAAGESTGETSNAFDRLAMMMKEQQQMRVRIIGTLMYPALLMVLALGVVGVLMFFVLPRFDDLYTMLDTPLPLLTRWMLILSREARDNAIALGVACVAAVVTVTLVLRLPQTKNLWDAMIVRIPLVGGLARAVILARIFRVWGTSVCSSVPLLDSLALCRNVTANAQFRALVDSIHQSASSGRSIGHTLERHPLVPRTLASPLAIGEQTGQLGEALVFLADYLDEDNAQRLAALTRLVEPIILIVLGLVVGLVAVSLFLPLFNLTGAAHG
ncbi:MAG: type II secretion system F family protein [Phycisphaerae bacterium]|nr:type II secretion system F family protein [Phycisphaerae bacterium]